MNRTVRLDLANAAGGACVLAEVVTATAIGCGTGPLAAARLRRAVEAAARTSTAPLRLETFEDGDRLLLVISVDDEAWADFAVEHLSAFGAVAGRGGVVVELRGSPLREVGVTDV